MSAVRQFICWFASIDWTPEAVTAAGTIALAFLTLVLAVGTLFLWLATRHLVRGTEKTAGQQLRAYLSIEVKRHGAHNLTPQFNLFSKNCGRTPAYNGIYWVDIKVRESPLGSDLITQEEKTIYRFELPPTGGFSVWQFNDDNIASLCARQSDEFNRGKIDFVDAFDKPHWLKFRFRYGKECVASGNLAVEEIKSN